MNIDRAIEILSDKVKHPYARTRLAYPDALKLGIEALKHLEASRPTGLHPGMYRLPGETEE